MPSQSINTEIIKGPDTITQSTLSKTFALLLIEDQGLIQRGGGGAGVGGGVPCVMKYWRLDLSIKKKSKKSALHAFYGKWVRVSVP